MAEQNFENLRAINENIIVRKIEDDKESSPLIHIVDSKTGTYCKAVVISVGRDVEYTQSGDELIINAISPMIHKDDDGNEYYCVAEEQVYCKVR